MVLSAAACSYVIHGFNIGLSVNKIHSREKAVKTGMFIACGKLPAFYKPAAKLYNSVIQALQNRFGSSTGAALKIRLSETNLNI
ncbi:hypothetical protein LG198_01740 [Methylobacillus arboreus]|uniref:hypothetical protein n=1 Tax=Methylobacillus arboreus TaxID=755170 RepID=UPI001E366143|nr:hypothetical protein [Methylobacillus arboreus]MCB5189453.1 hypothetical protein [Methylobacillus arboreus]